MTRDALVPCPVEGCTAFIEHGIDVCTRCRLPNLRRQLGGEAAPRSEREVALPPATQLAVAGGQGHTRPPHPGGVPQNDSEGRPAGWRFARAGSRAVEGRK